MTARPLRRRRRRSLRRRLLDVDLDLRQPLSMIVGELAAVPELPQRRQDRFTFLRCGVAAFKNAPTRLQPGGLVADRVRTGSRKRLADLEGSPVALLRLVAQLLRSQY